MSDEKFSSLGLDSLGMRRLAAELEGLLGIDVPAVMLWSHPTVKSLTERLWSRLNGEEGDTASMAEALPARRNPGRNHEPVAVVGMACRFPGAEDIEAFWRLLCDGVDAIGPAPSGRWAEDAFSGTDPHPTEAGFLSQSLDGFDPAFFGISPSEARDMDPQQRLFLEVAWEALEDASMTGAALRGSDTGVFAGALWHDYADLAAGSSTPHSATGRALNMVANRLSYVLGLQGPSMTLDSACSSSLLAVHLACQSLWSGESSAAVAGGVNLLLSPETMISLNRFGGLSPDGRCKAFDAAADGFGRGEGCGVIILKTLSRALSDGDDIWCVLRGTAANNDGPSNGLTAPSSRAQARVIRDAVRRSGVSPLDVHYVEAHGTGTFIGDPIEATALGEVYGRGRSSEQPLVVGSVKTNIGHLEGAAGIAGLIKTALCLRHRRIPGNLHLTEPNPQIDFAGLGLSLPATIDDWPSEHRGLAGVSSFGWGGTNVHVIAEEWPVPEPPPTIPSYGEKDISTGAIAFVFSPHGQQWTGMAAQTLIADPVFRHALERCDRAFAESAGWSLKEQILSGEELPEDVGVVQPVLCAIQIAIAAWLRERGVRPDAVVGHSLGEIPAAVSAGILDVPSAMRLIHHYSFHQTRIAGLGGAMAVVELPEAELSSRLVETSPDVSVAGRNGSGSTLLTGRTEALKTLLSGLKADGVLCSMIDVGLAAHGPDVDSVADDLEQALDWLQPAAGDIPMISTVTGAPLTGTAMDGAYFARNLRAPVRLAEATEYLMRCGYDRFVEISARPVLLSALRRTAHDAGRPVTVLPTMREGEDGRIGLAETLAALGSPERAPRPELFTLTAMDPGALRGLADRIADLIRDADAQDEGPSVADLAHATAIRAQMPYRLAAVATTPKELTEHLRDFAQGDTPAGVSSSKRPAGGVPRVAFVFPGQGSQWQGMGRDLLETEPVFASAVHEFDGAAREFLDFSLVDVLRAVPEEPGLDHIDVIQPLLTAVQIALARLWRSWGVEPVAVVGHSMGEVAAAQVAGALSISDAARVICLRSRLMRRLSGRGAMLAVELSLEQAERVTRPYTDVVSVAVNNGPESTVLSGDREALESIARDLERDSVFIRWVKVDVASHSPQMDELRDDLLEYLRPLSPHDPEIAVHSTVYGQTVGAADLGPEYWMDNLRRPVLFSDTMTRLVKDTVDVVLEISPHPILTPAITQVAEYARSDTPALPSLRRHKDGREQLMRSLGELHVLGLPIAGSAVLPAPRVRVKLPHYPWQRSSYWHGSPTAGGPPRTSATDPLGEYMASPLQEGVYFWQAVLTEQTCSAFDHRPAGRPVLPGAAYVDMALRSAAQILGPDQVVLTGLDFPEAAEVPPGSWSMVQSVLTPGGGSSRTFQVFTRQEDEEAVAVAAMEVTSPSRPADREQLDHEGIRRRLAHTADRAGVYQALTGAGLDYGPAYQGVENLWSSPEEALARIGIPESWASGIDHAIHPALLDSALQTAAFVPLTASSARREGTTLVSAGMRSVAVHGALPSRIWAHSRVRDIGDGGWEADVDLADDSGAILVMVRGLRLVTVTALPTPEDADTGTAGGNAFLQALHELPHTERSLAVEAEVRASVARLLELPPNRIDVSAPVRPMGIDSVMSLDLRRRLEARFGARLSATLVWNHPTVRDMTAHVALKAGLTEEASSVSPESPGHSELSADVLSEPAPDDEDPLARLDREIAELNLRMENL